MVDVPITIYVSHPQVVIDADVPVPEWGLNDRGHERAAALAGAGLFGRIDRLVTSDERKALDTTRHLLAGCDLEPVVDPLTGETDRSVPGFAPPDEFEVQADAWFAHPEVSTHGWELAVDAQRRIVEAHARALDGLADDDVLVMVGHGGVGTLLWCHFADAPIDRRHDQPFGGHLYVIGADGRPDGPWRSFESADG